MSTLSQNKSFFNLYSPKITDPPQRVSRFERHSGSDEESKEL